MNAPFNSIAIIGSGATARGIAERIARAQCTVTLYDPQPAVPDTVYNAPDAACQPQVRVASDLNAIQSCDLVVLADTHHLRPDSTLLLQLEAVLPATTCIASNAAHSAITALAAALQQPGRFAGLHFCHPVTTAQLVEVVSGLRTDSAITQRLAEFAQRIGCTPVVVRDAPGSVVNQLYAACFTEALRIVSEGIADFAGVDRILRDQAGFAMGPFEAMDYLGLDAVQPMTESVYRQLQDEQRFRPATLGAQRLSAGLVGRACGEGFYRYHDGLAQMPPEQPVPVVSEFPPVWLSPRAARRAEMLLLLKNLGARIETGQSPSPQALTLVAPLGFDVTTVAVVERLDPARTIGIDTLIDDNQAKRRVLATNPSTRTDMRDAAHALFARDGKAVSTIRDSAGFVTQRVIAQIVNTASDICQQGLCTPADLELASAHGLGLLQGALATGNLYGPTNVLEVLFNMQTVYGDARYRPSPWLRRRGAIGLSLLHEEE